MTSTLGSATLREWIRATKDHDIPAGISVPHALGLAEQVWGSLLEFADVRVLVSCGRDVADVLHALTQFLESHGNDLSVMSLPPIRLVSDFVVNRPELILNADERNAILARLAYRAWDICRRAANCLEMNRWADRCANHVYYQEGVRAFLNLRASERSEALSARFLSESETLLATCWRLNREKNRAPASSVEEATLVYKWLIEQGPVRDMDEHAYFAGELALTVSGPLGHLGRYREAMEWAELAALWFHKTGQPAPWLAKVQFASLVILARRHLPRKVLESIAPILAGLRKFGHASEIFKCRLLEALSLKDLGREREAFELLDSMRREPDLRDDPLVLGLVMVNMGEIAAGRGDLERAQSLLADASKWLVEADTGWAVANLRGVVGQVLRDLGRLSESVEAYRSAIAIYATLQMVAYVAYFRVLLAEILILAGRQDEASLEIVAALPVLERESLLPDAVAAIALLRESIRRQKADPEALRALRLQLKKMREVEQ